MLSQILPLIFAALIGVAMSSQAAINSQLKTYLNSPLQASLISFLVGTFCLLLLSSIEQAKYPTLSQLQTIPLWLFFGGLLGVYGVSMSIYTAPKLGFISFTGLVLFGQVLMSMLLDHFGWFGVEKNPIHWQRLLGAMCIAIGIILTLQR